MAAKYEVLEVPTEGKQVWSRCVRSLFTDGDPTMENVVIVTVYELTSGHRVIDLDVRESAPAWDDPDAGARSADGAVMHAVGASALSVVLAEAALVAVSATSERGTLPMLPRRKSSDAFDVTEFGEVA